ncbi:WXG100 family type VII secretion target [Streptomyces sp. NPDC054765]
MNQLSTNYDNAVITVDPGALTTHAKNLYRFAGDVADSVQIITDTLFNLPVGWAGTTSDEVQDFAHRWKNLMVELFGTEKNPDSGALNAMADGTQAAADAFDGTEEALVNMFRKFLPAYSSGSSTSGTSVTDTTQTAITETF